jgi:hypothetical protein
MSIEGFGRYCSSSMRQGPKPDKSGAASVRLKISVLSLEQRAVPSSSSWATTIRLTTKNDGPSNATDAFAISQLIDSPAFLWIWGSAEEWTSGARLDRLTNTRVEGGWPGGLAVIKYTLLVSHRVEYLCMDLVSCFFKDLFSKLEVWRTP